MAFNPSDYGWTDQDVLDAFVNDPAAASKFADENNISAGDLADWANSVPGSSGDWTSAKIATNFGVNLIPTGLSSSKYTGTYQPAPAVTKTSNFDPSSYNLTDQDIYDAFTNDPGNAANLANQAGITAEDLADWANAVPGGGGWTADKVNQAYGVNYATTSGTSTGTSAPTVTKTGKFDPSKWGLTDQDIYDAFTNDPMYAANLANQAGITAQDLADWANSVPGSGGDWTADKVNQAYGVNQGPIQLYQPNTYPSSYSGMDKQYLDQIMQAIMPEFKKSVTNLNSNISKYFDEAKNYNTKQGADLLQGVLQQQTNSLASKNILNSSIASTALGNATGEVLKNINNQNMQLGMQEAKAKTDLPSALGQLLQYGKVSTWSDPSVPIKNLLSLF